MDMPTANLELGVIPGLKQEAAEWSAKFQEGTVTSPLRIILTLALVCEMMTRLENCMKDPTKCAREEEIGWMSPGHHALDPVWHYWAKEKQPRQTRPRRYRPSRLQKHSRSGERSGGGGGADNGGRWSPGGGVACRPPSPVPAERECCLQVSRHEMRLRPERLARQPAAKQLEEHFMATAYCRWSRRK